MLEIDDVFAYLDRKVKYIEETESSIEYIHRISITKHSSNIIDLIECGDYVNGYPVRKINGVLCNFDLNNMKWTPLKEIDVWGDIATHEQFNSIKYEVK